MNARLCAGLFLLAIASATAIALAFQVEASSAGWLTTGITICAVGVLGSLGVALVRSRPTEVSTPLPSQPNQVRGAHRARRAPAYSRMAAVQRSTG